MKKHTRIISSILALVTLLVCTFMLMTVVTHAEETDETAASGESMISMKMETPEGTYDLTTLGSVDWITPYEKIGKYIRKDIDKPVIEQMAVNGGMEVVTKEKPFSFAWSDGDATMPSSTGYCYYAWGWSASFQYSVPVESYHQTLTMFIGIYMGYNRVQAYFESNPDEVFEVELNAIKGKGGPAGKATIDFVGTPGDKLIVTFKRVGFCPDYVTEADAWQCQSHVFALALHKHELSDVVYVGEDTHKRTCTIEGCDYSVESHCTAAEAVQENIQNATCSENGSYDSVVYCSGCGREISREAKVVNSTGAHIYATETEKVEATCTADGYVIKACGCGKTEKTTLTAIGHDYEAVKTVPTCTEAGYTTYTCKNDSSHTYVADEVAALGHTPSETVVENNVEPDCDDAGSYDNVVYCAVCTVEVSRDTVTVSAKNHTEVIDEAIDATCTEAGKTEGKHCSVCNEILVAQEEVSAKGHTEVIDEAVAPGCTTVGKTEGKHCSVCNEILIAQEGLSALGHTEVADEAVAPTCTESGKTEGKHCSVCHEVIVAQNEIEARGHDWVDATAEAPKTCKTCGATEGTAVPEITTTEPADATDAESNTDSADNKGCSSTVSLSVGLLAVILLSAVAVGKRVRKGEDE